MKYKILDENDRIVEERDLRKLLFEYETEDLLNNKEDYLANNWLSLEEQLKCIEKAKNGTIEEIIDMLETSWNVPIEPIVEDFELQVVFEDNILYIGTESSSGCKYKCETRADIKKSIIEYIDSYL